MTLLVSIDTTPNPNSMKLNLDEPLPQTGTFTMGNEASAPEIVRRLLPIEGVQSIFVSVRFLTINRDPRVAWEPILQAVEAIFTDSQENTTPPEEKTSINESYGQLQVLVQTFRDVPIQVKVTDGEMEKRVGLSARFADLASELQKQLGADYLKERHWADWGVRYGSVDDVAQEIAEEIETLLDADTLNQRKQLAIQDSAPQIKKDAQELPLNQSDWHERLRAVQQLEASEEHLPLLIQALQDAQPQIRRWAAAKLAGIKTIQSVEALCQSLLNDSNVGVRRTAGDSLSDIGDVSAQDAMCQALSDDNKLVRWRAARFLAEVGTEAALPSLKQAQNDSETEVRFEVKAAIQHIQEGSKAALPVWKLMSQES